MNVDLTLAEVKAVAAVLEPAVDGDSRLMTAWLKLIRAQAQATAPTSGPTTVGAVDTWGLW